MTTLNTTATNFNQLITSWNADAALTCANYIFENPAARLVLNLPKGQFDADIEKIVLLANKQSPITNLQRRAMIAAIESGNKHWIVVTAFTLGAKGCGSVEATQGCPLTTEGVHNMSDEEETTHLRECFEGNNFQVKTDVDFLEESLGDYLEADAENDDTV